MPEPLCCNAELRSGYLPFLTLSLIAFTKTQHSTLAREPFSALTSLDISVILAQVSMLASLGAERFPTLLSAKTTTIYPQSEYTQIKK